MKDHEQLADIACLVSQFSPVIATDILRLAAIWRRQMTFLDDMVEDAQQVAVTDIRFSSNVVPFVRRHA